MTSDDLLKLIDEQKTATEEEGLTEGVAEKGDTTTT